MQLGLQNLSNFEGITVINYAVISHINITGYSSLFSIILTIITKPFNERYTIM